MKLKNILNKEDKKSTYEELSYEELEERMTHLFPAIVTGSFAGDEIKENLKEYFNLQVSYMKNFTEYSIEEHQKANYLFQRASSLMGHAMRFGNM